MYNLVYIIPILCILIVMGPRLGPASWSWARLLGRDPGSIQDWAQIFEKGLENQAF